MSALTRIRHECYVFSWDTWERWVYTNALSFEWEWWEKFHHCAILYCSRKKSGEQRWRKESVDFPPIQIEEPKMIMMMHSIMPNVGTDSWDTMPLAAWSHHSYMICGLSPYSIHCWVSGLWLSSIRTEIKSEDRSMGIKKLLSIYITEKANEWHTKSSLTVCKHIELESTL